MTQKAATTRRQFLRWMGLAPAGAAALAGTSISFGCGSSAGASSHDAGDAARSDAIADLGADPTADIEVGGADLSVGDGADNVCELTGSDVQGPFFVEGAPQRTTIADNDEPGERLSITGVVLGPDCESPISGALLDIWQADEEGEYHDETEDYRLRGQVLSNLEGAFAFDTIRPGHYPQGGSFRPAHIHFMVSAPGYRPLTTQLYFAGDPFLAPNDPCGGCGSGDDSLIIDLAERANGEQTAWTGHFEIVLERA